MIKALCFELVSREEWYDVRLENDKGEEVSYSVHYHKEENVGWDSYEVLDEEGHKVPEGELLKEISKAFKNVQTKK